MIDRIPCRRPPLLLGLGRLAGVRIGVVRVLVRRREADLAFVPATEHSSCFSLYHQLHKLLCLTVYGENLAKLVGFHTLDYQRDVSV